MPHQRLHDRSRVPAFDFNVTVKVAGQLGRVVPAQSTVSSAAVLVVSMWTFTEKVVAVTASLGGTSLQKRQWAVQQQQQQSQSSFDFKVSRSVEINLRAIPRAAQDTRRRNNRQITKVKLKLAGLLRLQLAQ